MYACVLSLLLRSAHSQPNVTVTVSGLGSGSGSGDTVDVFLETATSSGVSLLVPLTSSPSLAGSTIQVQSESSSAPILSPSLLPTPSPSLRLPLILVLSESVPYMESEKEYILGNITESLAALFNVSQEQIEDVQLITRGRRQTNSFNAISFSIRSGDVQSQEQLQGTVVDVQDQVCDLPWPSSRMQVYRVIRACSYAKRRGLETG